MIHDSSLLFWAILYTLDRDRQNAVSKQKYQENYS